MKSVRFFYRECKLLLGYSTDRNAADQSKFEAIKNSPVPTTASELNAFSCLFNFYSRFMKKNILKKTS